MIQWSRVSELREDIGEDGFDEAIALFLVEVEDVIARLRTAPVTGAVQEDMHFLRGSALNLGFDAFARLCQRGEQMAAEGRAPEIGFSEMFAIFEASKTQFLKGLPVRLAS